MEVLFSADEPSSSETSLQREESKNSIIFKRTKTRIKLENEGNFRISQPVPSQVIEDSPYASYNEFKFMNYTAATCQPDMFSQSGYTLRTKKYRRKTEIFVVVTMYNEDDELFTKTMFAIAKNIKYLCEKNKYIWDKDGWKYVTVCIVADGRKVCNKKVLMALELMGVYQDGLTQAMVNGHEVVSHIYEYTTQNFIDEKKQYWTAKEGFPPMQVIFCLKEKNKKKLNSHRWFFRGFCPILDPNICILIDVGTKPSKNAFYQLWKVFHRNSQIAGACGEIRAEMGSGTKYIKSLCNPLIASQNFEYKISNLLDKSLESVFGYISVLPGAFSAYRYEALADTDRYNGPLVHYFRGENQEENDDGGSGIFDANIYLAEDRILCFELISKKNESWTLHYTDKAYAETDVPNSMAEFISQRRRWLNGSMFASMYALFNYKKIWNSGHHITRKVAILVQYVYMILNQLFQLFAIGNFAVAFYFLIQELKELFGIADMSENDTDVAKNIVKVVVASVEFSYPVLLIIIFVASFGNRPQAFKRVYQIVMTSLSLIGGMMVALMGIRLYKIIVESPKNISDYDKIFNSINSSGNKANEDGFQLVNRQMIDQIKNVLKENVSEVVINNKINTYSYIISMISIYGVMFVGSFLHGEYLHMFTCFIQYLIMLPSYINMLNIYAFSNIHDVSWGTKGDNTITSGNVAVTKKEGDDIVVDLNLLSDEDKLLHYEKQKRKFSEKTVIEKKAVDQQTLKDDNYKAFRSNVIIIWVLANGLFFVIATQLFKGNTFFLILLGCMALLNVMKFAGVLTYTVLKFITSKIKLGKSNKEYQYMEEGRNKNKKKDNKKYVKLTDDY